MAAKGTGTKKGKAGSAPAEGAQTPAYVVFARRFRPQSFADVVGQETITAALRHALRTGRLAQAYLLAGPRGVGKTSLARIFAKALNCQKGAGPGGVAEEPCNECEACAAVQDGTALDVIEMDAATHRGIAEIRDLRDNVGLAPSQLRTKVYIVDEVHMLTTEAWNAFLKTLEEPPAHVKFIFATTDADKIPETILSRCQRFDLRRIGLADTVRRLRQICEGEKVEFEPAALDRIAGLSKGGLRDAEGLLDQAVNLGEGKVTDEVVRRIAGAAPDELIFEVLTACAKGQVGAALKRTGEALEAGADPDDLLAAFCERLRGTLLTRTCGPESALLEGQSHLKDAYAKLAAELSEDQLLMLLQLFANARRQVRDAAQARLPLEMALVRAARAQELVDLGKLVAALESGTGAAHGAPGAPPAREGPCPNSSGRPAGAEARPAAKTSQGPAVRRLAQDARAPSRPPEMVLAGRPARWGEVLGAAHAQTGGITVVAALNHAASVRLDLGAGVLEVGFTDAQGNYVEMLTRPERLALLTQTLQSVYGREITLKMVTAERVRMAVPQAAPVRSGGAPDPKAQPAQEEEEQAFDDEGALPLPERPTVETASGADVSGAGDEELGPPATGEVAPLEEPVEEPSPRPAAQDATVAAEHPLVKALVAGLDGEVVRVDAGAGGSARKGRTG